ncbi:sensor histidine kinase [Alicyclobacillus ferrooxydans]|uniref:sensor histidine kinase n=1 Tax=Alicyclobacillus ferrooxydans TaxID=471514 RepID=UPI0006D58955|nr:ATP-binding protein [Alicyclobacillus ferrooxydans]
MINRLRFRLALVNASLIFVVLIVLGGVLYLFTEHRLYTQFDQDMASQAAPVIKRVESGLSVPKVYRGAILVNPNSTEALKLPTALFVWSNTGQLLSSKPTFIASSDLATLQSHRSPSRVTISIGAHHFRLLNRNIVTPNGQVTIQLVRLADQVVGTLYTLLMILLIGSIIGALGSMAVGFLIADRSIVPIRKAWERQTQFVSDASHELKTPLMAISAHVEMLLRNPEHTIEQESDKIGSIYSESKRVSRLVENLLLLSRSDAEQMMLQRRMVDIEPILESTVNNFLPLCEMKQIQLTKECPKPFMLVVDEERFTQLLYIVLDNALKYTGDGGTIHVSAVARHRAMELSVRDTGIGIAAEDIPHIFERFYRADKARSRGGGAGLGLSIAKWIVEGHGGHVSVLSEQGRDTKFTFLFPFTPNM